MFTYAGFWKRFLAYLIDQIILSGVRFILFIPFWLITFASYYQSLDFNDSEIFTSVNIISTSREFSVALLTTFIFVLIIFGLVNLIIEWLYFCLMESSAKQATLGKMILSIKVTDINGNKISFGRATARHFAKILSGLFLMIGYIMAAFTEKKQALHDIVSNSLVVDSIILYSDIPQQ